MKTSLPRGFALLLTLFASTVRLHAHPGHDDHDLTWDFTHLAAHPLATAGWAAILLAAGGLGWYMLRRSGRSRLPEVGR